MKNVTTNMRAGQDILLKSHELEINGSFIRAENDLEMDAKKIKLEASADRYSAKSRSIGANLGITFWGAEGVSVGANYGTMKSEGTMYNNTQIQAGNKLKIKADNMEIRGGRAVGKHVEADIRENLLVESLQDKEEMKQIGVNVGYSMQKGKGQDGKPDNRHNGSLGGNYGRKDKAWVAEQSGIIGTESADVKVGKELALIGGIIANIDENGKDKGNLTLSYGSLRTQDIESHDKMINLNGNIEINQRSRDNNTELVLNNKKGKNKTGDNVKEVPNRVDETYGVGVEGHKREKVTRATIGNGTVNSGKPIEVGVNRDITRAEEMLKDVNVQKTEFIFKSEPNSWGDFNKIMSSNAGIIGNFLDDMNEHTGNKVRTNYEDKFRTRTSSAIASVESKLVKLNNMTGSLMPLQEHHGGLLEQIVRTVRKDKAPIIEVTLQKGKNGEMLMGMVEKRRLSEVGIDKDGNRLKNVQAFINGITEVKSNATRNAIFKNMTEENKKRFANGEEVKIALVYNPSRGMVSDLFESFMGKVFDGSLSSLGLSTGISRGTAIALASGAEGVNYDLGLYSQGNIVGLGAFNILKNNGIKLGDGQGSYKVGMYGTPIRRNTIQEFENSLGITFRGAALNTPDFVANSKKIFGLSGESRLINALNVNSVKEHSWKDNTGNWWFAGKAIFREQRMPGLFIPVLPGDKKILKEDYLYSVVPTDEQLKKINDNYFSAKKDNKPLTLKEMNSLVSNPHGTYVYKSAEISEQIYNKFEEYKSANNTRKEEILGEVIELYKKDQALKLDLAMNGPAILDNSPFLLKARDEYNREELIREYNAGRYHDKGLPGIMNVGMSVEEKRKELKVSDITSYLRKLRQGVER